MHSWTEQEIEQLVEAAIRRSLVDAGFREQLVEDSQAALSQITDRPLPQDPELRFIEDPYHVRTVVLPPLVNSDGELSEAALDRVAGGSCMTTNL